MKKQTGIFHRDASNRLCFEIHAVDSLQYPELTARVTKQFNLTAVGEMVVGLDEVFRDYSDGSSRVGLEWDIWSGFIVVAKTPESEALVNSIAAFLAVS